MENSSVLIVYYVDPFIEMHSLTKTTTTSACFACYLIRVAYLILYQQQQPSPVNPLNIYYMLR